MVTVTLDERYDLPKTPCAASLKADVTPALLLSPERAASLPGPLPAETRLRRPETPSPTT